MKLETYRELADSVIKTLDLNIILELNDVSCYAVAYCDSRNIEYFQYIAGGHQQPIAKGSIRISYEEAQEYNEEDSGVMRLGWVVYDPTTERRCLYLEYRLLFDNEVNVKQQIISLGYIIAGYINSRK